MFTVQLGTDHMAKSKPFCKILVKACVSSRATAYIRNQSRWKKGKIFGLLQIRPTPKTYRDLRMPRLLRLQKQYFIIIIITAKSWWPLKQLLQCSAQCVNQWSRSGKEFLPGEKFQMFKGGISTFRFSN